MSDTLAPILVNGVHVPGFMYGTAWKEEETHRLTALALEAGFRAIDTANQRRHYYEAAVGEAIRAAIGSGQVTREALFVQSKYTFIAGQDHRLPYDPEADHATQVRQSFANSLEHLHTDYLDSYVLHGPSTSTGLQAADWAAWGAMEELYETRAARLLGVSNVNSEQLRALLASARVKPSFVQNRCYASKGWDAEVREICAAHGVVYQGFSLLTANRTVLAEPALVEIAARNGATPAQVIFRFAHQIGMLPLTGTSNPEHMRQDLGCAHFTLESDAMRCIEGLGIAR